MTLQAISHGFSACTSEASHLGRHKPSLACVFSDLHMLSVSDLSVGAHIIVDLGLLGHPTQKYLWPTMHAQSMHTAWDGAMCELVCT